MSNYRSLLLLSMVGLSMFLSYDLVRRPALSLFAETLGAEPLIVGLIVSLSTVTGVFLKLPMGVISDILDRRAFMIVGLLAFALPPFVYPWVSDLSTLAILRLFHGLATALFTPLALASVAEMFPKQRGEALGWYTSAPQGGGLLGPMLGGVLIYYFGFTPTFLTAGIFGVLGFAVFLFIPRTKSSTKSQTISMGSMFREFLTGIGGVIKNVGMLGTSFAEAAKMMATGTLMAFLPLYGLSVGLNPAEIGLLFGIQALVSLVCRPTMGRISDRFGREPLIFIGLCCCGVTLIFMPHANEFSSLLLLAAGFGFGEAVVTSSSAALIADLSQSNSIGAGMGLRGTIMDIGHASGPLVAGLLIEQLSYLGGFMAIGIIQFLAALIFGLIMIGIRKPAVL